MAWHGCRNSQRKYDQMASTIFQTVEQVLAFMLCPNVKVLKEKKIQNWKIRISCGEHFRFGDELEKELWFFAGGMGL